MVAGASDPDGPVIGAGTAECAEPRRPISYRCRQTLQGERGGCAESQQGVDREVCIGLDGMELRVYMYLVSRSPFSFEPCFRFLYETASAAAYVCRVGVIIS